MDFTANDAFAPVFKADRLLHSYIIIGSPGPAVKALADTLAAAMICESRDKAPCGGCRSCKKSIRGLHPDIIRISPPNDKKEIPVGTVRDIRAEAVVMPNEADAKVFIIESADFMNASAQNALLKILEEPPRHVRFILLAENPALLLDTVRSRCAEIRLHTAVAQRDEGIAETAKSFFKAIKSGNLPLAQFACTLEKLDRDTFTSFLEEVKAQSVTLLKAGTLSSSELFRINSAVDEAAKYLKFNVNPVHVSGMLCAKLLQPNGMPLK